MKHFTKPNLFFIAMFLTAILFAPNFIYAQNFPSAQTTGITASACPNWQNTKTNTRGRTISQDGTIIENQEITGQLTITANDVKLKCVKINPNGAIYGINCFVGGGCPGLMAENIEITNCKNSCANIKSNDPSNPAVLSRSYIHGSTNDLLKVEGNSTIEYSYIADFNPAPGAHNDAIQTSQGSNIIINGNSINGPLNQQTSAYIVKTDFGPTDNLVLFGNYFSGGAYTLYLRTGGNGNPTDVLVQNNVWQKNSAQYGYLSSDMTKNDCLEWGNNTFSDGSAFLAPSSASSVGSCRAKSFGGGGGGGSPTPTPTRDPTPSPQPNIVCHTIFAPTMATRGFGLPYHASSNTTLLKALCSDSSNFAVITAGIDTGLLAASTYVWPVGYHWSGSAWTKINYICDSLQVSGWCIRSASAGITRHKKSNGGDYVIAYTCTWDGSRWRCGCADRACTTPSWQLQFLK